MIIRKRPTLRMIAEELGVTITTVSCILSNKGGTYAESTRQKVFEVANRLKYRPNALANGMRGGKTHSAGVMIRNRGHYLSSIVNAIHDTLLERDTVMFLAWNKWLRFEEGWSPDTERQVIHHLLDRRVDGFIIVPTSEEFDRFYFEEITERHIPIVLVDRELKSIEADYVGTDNLVGGAVAGRHLLELGHRRILYCGESACSNSNERGQSFFQAFEGVADTQKTTLDFLTNDFRDRLIELFQNPANRPTGIFCMNDFVARFVLEVAAGLAFSAPRDFSIIGFGDQHQTDPLLADLATFDQKPSIIGQTAAECYLAQVHTKSENYTQRSVKIEPEFLKKGSTGPVPS